MKATQALRISAALGLLFLAGPLFSAEKEEGWIVLFNGKDLTGWKLKAEQYTLTKFVDVDGKEIKGAKKAKLDQKDTVVDAKGKAIEGAKVGKIDGKDVPVDAEGKAITDAKIAKTGGRDAIVGSPTARSSRTPRRSPRPCPTRPAAGRWRTACSVRQRPHGSDLYTEQKFTDFELHVEFQGTANSGVYLQGRYEIQVDNDYGEKPKIVEKDGKKVEGFPQHQCGAIYGRSLRARTWPSRPRNGNGMTWPSVGRAARTAR